MERVNLLSTDQSSSEVRMTATGQSNHTGSTRTRAAKGLFSHFILLAGVMLIALLTSGKASAEDYKITLSGSNLSLEGAAEDGTLTQSTDTRTFTLVAAEGYKLPEVGDITVSITDGATINNGAEDSKWSYENGKITLGSSVSLSSGITVTADGVQKKDVATLATLQYQVQGGEETNVNGFSANTEPSGNYTVDLDAYTNKDITVTATATAESNATLSAASVTVSAENAVTTGATITVTSEDGSKTVEYKVMFTIPNDKLNEITVPSALSSGLTLSDRLTEAEVLALLNETADYNSFAITTEGGQDDLSLPVTWKLKGETFNPAPSQSNQFTWEITDAALGTAKLDKNDKTTTGDVTIKNAEASTSTVLSSLTYKIGADSQPVDITSDLASSDECSIELPYGTADDASITVNVACEENATAKLDGEDTATEFQVTLAGGEASLTLIITPESETPTRTVTINFTTTEELVTEVTGVPSTYTLTQAVADKDAAIALLEAMDMTDITLTANSGVALKLKWEYSGASFDNASGQSNNFTWTVVKEDGSEITAAKDVTATGTTTVTNYTVSKDAGIETLTYQVAGGTKETVPSVNEAPTTNDVTVAFGTKSITVSITPTNAKATVSLTDQPTDHGTLVDGVTSYETPVVEAFKFTITAEDGTTTKNFIIKFIVDKEKITAVTVPATYKLPETAADVAAAIAMLEDMEGVVIKTNGVTPTKLNWTYEKSNNGNNEYTNVGGKTNVFSWSAVRSDAGDALEAATGVAITGTTTVTNFMPAVTGDKSKEDVQITAENPVDKIGDGETATTVKSIEVPAGVTTEQLTINKATIVEKLDLKESVGEIVLNEVIIPEVILAENKTTVLTLQSGNEIAQITNAGTMTLNNAASIAPLSMAIETRAALPNSGAVKAVDNNGKFTDNTAKIVTVGGDADLRITTLPANKLNATSDITLAIVAESTNGNITYQWEKAGSNDSWTTAGTDANLTVKKAGGNGTFRCKVVSTNKSADTKTTTLFTPSVSVTFKSASDPSTPSDPTPSTKTYTVTLKKVTGATFSQKETTTVDEGDDFSFTIKLDKDYDQSKPVVKVGTTTYTADAKGVYTIKNITKDITIEVSGIVKNAATGVEETAQDAVRAWSDGSTLYIHTPEAAEVYVVSGAGALMRQLKAVPGDQNIQLPAGFYIVRIGTYTAKVIIR